MRKLIFTIVILLVALGASYLLLSRPQAKPPKSDQTTAEATSTDSPKATLQGLAQSLSLKPEIQTYNYMDWLDSDKNPQPLAGVQFLVGTMNINGLGKYGNFSSENLQQVTLKNLAPLSTAADKYFMQYGFKKNTVNTHVEANPPSRTAWFGYEKGSEKCVVRLDELTDPFGNFVCGTIDTEQAALQQQFRSLFFGKTAEKQFADDIDVRSFRVTKVEGDYALGSASGQVTGYMWMAKRTGNAWHIVWRGNDIATCSDMQKAGIPKSIYGNCYDENAK